MGEEKVGLDHIAIYVTDLERSRKFYRDVLRMTVSEPVSLREQSSGLKYGHSLITHTPKMVRNWVSKNNPAAYQHMFTDICHCSAADGRINLILVQQTHPEKGYIRSVSGNSIYGFSFEISAAIDTEDFAWDLNIADISFEHGDIRTDGTIYSPDQPFHSIYIRDPDGRMIELISSESGKTGEFLVSQGHVVLYVSDMKNSIRYYNDALGLIDITPSYVPRDPWKKNITWLGTPGEFPVILLYQVTNTDGTPAGAGGYGLDHYALSGVNKPAGICEDAACISGHQGGHPYPCIVRDPDGYHIEC